MVISVLYTPEREVRRRKKLVLEAILCVLDKRNLCDYEISTFEIIKALLDIAESKGERVDGWLLNIRNLRRVLTMLGFEVRRKPHARKRIVERMYVAEALSEIKREEREVAERRLDLDKVLTVYLSVERQIADSNDLEQVERALLAEGSREAIALRLVVAKEFERRKRIHAR